MIKRIAWILCLGVTVAAARQERPNVVWLVSEDNSARWLKLYDDHGAPMPTVEKLAANGLVFNHAFSCAPVCTVARSTIISGCYAPRTGAQYHRKQQSVPMPEGLKMFPHYLRRAGYYTTNCSKEDYNFNRAETEGVWDESSKKAHYRNRGAGQPFFHVQNYHTTHESRLHFKNLDDPTLSDGTAARLYSHHPDTETFRYTYARQLDNHRKLDAEMGAFVRQLETNGVMDDTFIFYYGDHGGALPRGKGYIYNNGLHVPMVVYVPKNWRHLAPAAPGSRIDGFVEFVDLSATVLNLAGVEIPAGIDGNSFLGQGVALDELNRRDTTFGYADRFDEKYDLVRTVRKGRYKYMRNYQPFNFDGLYNAYRYKMLAYREWRDLYDQDQLSAPQKQFFERRPAETLYDLEKDPDEVCNLADDPAYTDTLREMRALLRRQVKSMPDLSFIPEPVFLREGGDNPVAYGQKQATAISRLIDIADLSLKAFPEAKPLIRQALESDETWDRYWGLIVCSSFGERAAVFYERAEAMAASDRAGLVRVRAAEFLGLTKQADPMPVIVDVLKTVDDHIEANLILNSAVLLEDAAGYDFDPALVQDMAWVKNGGGLVKNRLRYLAE